MRPPDWPTLCSSPPVSTTNRTASSAPSLLLTVSTATKSRSAPMYSYLNRSNPDGRDSFFSAVFFSKTAKASLPSQLSSLRSNLRRIPVSADECQDFTRSIAHNMTSKEKNYWLDTMTTPPAQSARELPDSVDVAVVGAGFCGLSAAGTLAKRGVNVAVFEAETFGWGASSRNGGMVLTGMKLSVPTLVKRYGREAVQKMYAASLESIDCVEEIVHEENIDCSFSRCGHLEVACKQSHFDGYEESAALIKSEFNHELRIVPKSELRGEIGSDIYFGGMLDETSAGLNPARYVAGLAHAAQRAGACLHDHTRVTSVELEKNNNARKFRVYP